MKLSPIAYLAASLSILLGMACGSDGVEIQSRTVQVGCGACRFHLEGYTGCYWAAEIDGKAVPIRGPAVPSDEGSHDPGGMCNVTRDAVVSGTLHATHFQATAIELMPVEAAGNPDFTPQDVH